MTSQVGFLALGVDVVALGVAAYGVSTRSSSPPDLEQRLQGLEGELARLAARSARPPAVAPTLRGSDGPWAASTPGDVRSPRPTSSAEASPLAASAGAGAAPTEAIEALVDKAVEEKTREVVDALRLKENKKPPLTLFASTLELTPEQVADLQDQVRQGQFDLHAVLEIPMADGSVLMDELAEVVATGMARPGDGGGWPRFVGRVMSEKIPGSDDTYAVRIEAIKTRLRETFRRDWSAEQYAEFEAWGVDPTEIQGIPGSPNEALLERIRERARALGAKVPDGR